MVQAVFPCGPYPPNGFVAQLEERRIETPEVAGSSPAEATMPL